MKSEIFFSSFCKKWAEPNCIAPAVSVLNPLVFAKALGLDSMRIMYCARSNLVFLRYVSEKKFIYLRVFQANPPLKGAV